MKKIISLALTVALALSIPVSAVDVYKSADLNSSVILPATVSVNDTQQNVTWEITKFSTATEGIITIPGYVTDDPEVKVYYHISVTEGASLVSATEVKPLFAEKKVRIVATTSEGFNGKASAVIYAKEGAPSREPKFSGASAAQSMEVDENNKATFVFDLKDFPSGDYVCYVTAGGRENKKSFSYLNYDDFVAAVTAVPDNAADKEATLLTYFNDYSILIELDLQSVYDVMTDEEKKEAFAQLPKKLDEVEGTVALTEILDKTDEIIATINLCDAADKQTIVEHSTLPYADILDLDIATDSYYDKIDNKTAFYSYFSTKDLSEKQKVMQNFYDGVAICSVNEADRTNIEKTLRDFNTVEELNVLNITDELDALDDLSKSNKESVLAQLVLINNFASTAQIKEKLGNLITLYSNGLVNGGVIVPVVPSVGGGSGSSGGSGGGSGSSGGTGGGLGGFGGLASVADTAKVEDNYEAVSFDDMSEAEWARPYVNKLASKGIISGYNNKIRPNDPITREEVAKLLVLSIDAKTNSNINFGDVPSSEWYYDYVNRLYSTGIIKGVSDNSFGTGLNITREDMATMVYRAMLWKNVADETISSNEAFSDDSAISDYAKNAVYKLKELEIISGVGENQFMPKGICSRAMIFKVLAEAFFN